MNNFVVLICLAAGLQAEVPATLLLKSQPGAQVYWEGRPVGSVGASGALQLSGMPYGSYSVAVEKDGYKRTQVMLQVGPGSREFTVTLEPEPVTAAISPAPTGHPAQIALVKTPPREDETGLPPQSGTPEEGSPKTLVARGAAALANSRKGGDAPPPGGSEAEVDAVALDLAPRENSPPELPLSQPGESGEAEEDGGAGLWWWLLLPGTVLAWFIWRRRSKASGPVRWSPVPEIPQDASLEAFMRTLSPPSPTIEDDSEASGKKQR